MTKTGAEALVSTLANNGITHCFANPGTSEMHLVQALDKEPRIKSVLCLFEGVATGAADGFARISGYPAMTLLHLGAGFGNGIANIHNAMKGFVPMINVIGDHATYHRKYEAPLTCDLETLIKPHSSYIGVVESALEGGEIAAAAFNAAINEPNSPVSIILPADSAWNEGGIDGPKINAKTPSIIEASILDDAINAIKSANKPVLLIGGKALYDDASLENMARLKEYGLRIMIDTFPARLKRGAGIFAPDRMQYFGEMALDDLKDVDLIVIAGTQIPVAFFAYPNKPSVLVPENCATFMLSERYENTKEALEQLVRILNAPIASNAKTTKTIERPNGKLNPFTCAQSLARLMPENSIISDDAVTAGLPNYIATQDAAKHDWLFLTGGAIGQGLPVALGAQMADMKRKVFALSGDGASMYTIQSLWTMARENLPIVTIIFANRNYRILNIEMARTGAGDTGQTANQMLSLENPNMDFVKIAEGFGVNSISVSTCEDFDKALENAIKDNKPWLIEAII
ncbi:MAG: acetolactate synthase large subunit [Caulobacterales bacterium]|nr:acetolactate synthase large subunit [Caulobacterales bacterium]